MAHVLTVTDDVSGTTILADGTKIHWTEGRSSELVVVHSDGRVERMGVWEPTPLVELMDKLSETGMQPQRQMTPGEKSEHHLARA